MLPTSLETALALGAEANPSVRLAYHNVDIASFNVNVAEGAMLPTVAVSGTLSSREDTAGPGTGADTASLVGKVTVPIGTGGANSSKVRAAKQTLGQRRIELDSARAVTRQAVISAWGTLDAARAQIRAANAQVEAESLVLSGITEELSLRR